MSALLTTILLVGDWLVRVGLACRIVMRRHPVSTSLAWLVLVTFTPFVGLAIYLLVGEATLGRRRADRLQRTLDGLEQRAAVAWKGGQEDWTVMGGPYDHVARLAARASGLPPLRGNHLELLADAGEFIRRLAEDIDRAEAYCHVQTYIWQSQGAGLVIGDALRRAAGRGVKCRLLIDGVGGRAFLGSDQAAALRDAGVMIAEALPAGLLRAAFRRVDLRNHRKIAVIDGHVAYTGSQNITDDTFRSRPTIRTGPWVEANLRLDGPAAQALGIVFLRDWSLEGRELPGLEEFLTEFPIRAGSTVHVLPSGPGPAPVTLHRAVLAMLFEAREEIIITTPYFVPDDATLTALITAAQRGARVVLVLPERSDARLAQAAARSHYPDLLGAGVHILHYPRGLLHAKTISIDRRLAMIGSANLDIRSFFLNLEASVLVYDDDVASQLRFLQTGYAEASREVTAEEWARRPLRRRAVENAARLFGPLL